MLVSTTRLLAGSGCIVVLVAALCALVGGGVLQHPFIIRYLASSTGTLHTPLQRSFLSFMEHECIWHDIHATSDVKIGDIVVDDRVMHGDEVYDTFSSTPPLSKDARLRPSASYTIQNCNAKDWTILV